MTAAQPVRLRLSRAKGFDLQALSLRTNGLPAINVGRPSRWGNPFVVGRDGTREDCTTLFVHLMHGGVCLTCRVSYKTQLVARRYIVKNLAALKGRNLACWCQLEPVDQAKLKCHADVLLRLTNGTVNEQ